MVTGATGFVGRSIVRELLAGGLTPVCLVRSPGKLLSQHRGVEPERLTAIAGSIHDHDALRRAAEVSQAAIHLVGIIIARPLHGQTFHSINTMGTINVVDAVRRAGIRRYAHMSALGTRPDAASRYHQTKWAAEEYVRDSGLDWTVFRPSLIHGPDGDFMRLLKRFVCGLIPPVIPCFGTGQAKIQPISVEDVAHCFVQSLSLDDTIGKTYPLGGPKAYSWREMYNVARATIPGAKRGKPVVSLPVLPAKLAAVVSAPVMGLLETAAPSLGMFRFDLGQVLMSQEDSVCDHTLAERAFATRLRNFEEELAAYADRIP